MNDLKITHHYQNQKFNNIHEFFWGFGSSFHTVYAVVPLFLKELALSKKEERQHKQYEMSFQIPKKIHECY